MALDDLVLAGKVVGVCNMTNADLAERLRIAASAGYRPIVSVQHRYNLLRQEALRPCFPSCALRSHFHPVLSTGFRHAQWSLPQGRTPTAGHEISPPPRPGPSSPYDRS